MFSKIRVHFVYSLFVRLMSCQLVKFCRLLSFAVKLILYYEMITAILIDLLISTW